MPSTNYIDKIHRTQQKISLLCSIFQRVLLGVLVSQCGWIVSAKTHFLLKYLHKFCKIHIFFSNSPSCPGTNTTVLQSYSSGGLSSCFNKKYFAGSIPFTSLMLLLSSIGGIFNRIMSSSVSGVFSYCKQNQISRLNKK